MGEREKRRKGEEENSGRGEWGRENGGIDFLNIFKC
jgi:hypothetical protein